MARNGHSKLRATVRANRQGFRAWWHHREPAPFLFQYEQQVAVLCGLRSTHCFCHLLILFWHIFHLLTQKNSIVRYSVSQWYSMVKFSKMIFRKHRTSCLVNIWSFARSFHFHIIILCLGPLCELFVLVSTEVVESSVVSTHKAASISMIER